MKQLPQTFECRVAGMSFRPGYPENLLTAEEHGILPGAGVGLKREPDNPHDPNAIGVWGWMPWGDAEHVGFIPANVARTLAPLMDAGVQWSAVLNEILIHPDAPHQPGMSIQISRDA